jgi:hypothetical protein
VSDVSAPVLPDYEGACIANVVPELIKVVMKAAPAGWVPPPLLRAKQVVLLVLDGLGWTQYEAHSQMLPTLDSFERVPITSVAPTSTPTGLTSIVTARVPAVHGVLGYRMKTAPDQALDVIGWSVNGQDARELVEPEKYQTQPAFAANRVPAIIERRHLDHGFTRAMMQGIPTVGYTTTSGLPIEVWRLAKAGEPLIYAYYGGIDAVAHAHGLDEHYDAELYTVDRLIRDIIAGLPSGCALVVTSDHGQVQVGSRNLDIDAGIVDQCSMFSGEGRFRWLHAKNPDKVDALAGACRESLSGLAWVKTKQELSDEQVFGGTISKKHWDRVGDVALIAYEPVSFKDPLHPGERNMVSRHGSLTIDEMIVPLMGKVVG